LDSIDNQKITSLTERIAQKDGPFSILASMYKYRDEIPPLGAPVAPDKKMKKRTPQPAHGKPTRERKLIEPNRT
jgi:hypothetical protein